jgi:predicted Fe-Mo cluster-binding NifX family protein
MEVAFPVQEDRGIESMVYSHFGSAPLFIIADTENNTAEAVANKDLDHHHGQCQPLSALNGKHADAVVVGGIGRGALLKLWDAGVKVYRAVEGTVNENLKLIKSGLLPEFTPEQTCAGHGKNGVCAH